MGKHIKQLSILIMCLSVFMCAGSRKRLDEVDLYHRLLGEWEWVESFGGFAGEHRTPESEGYTKRYYFSPYRVFLQYGDDSLVFAAEYRITEKVVWKKDKAKVLEIEGMTDQIIRFDGSTSPEPYGSGQAHHPEPVEGRK